jgi:hypothetical protein
VSAAYATALDSMHARLAARNKRVFDKVAPFILDPRARLAAYFEILVIFEPCMPRPAIRPFWSKMKA